jgi:Holliday junction resolvase RusA-like endonuclease
METKNNNQILGHWVIYGKPEIKKNSQRTIWHKYLKRNIVVYKAEYTAWKKDFLKQLGMCVNGKFINNKTRIKDIDCPVILKCLFYVPDKRRRDISNLYEGCQDILVEAGILKDDCYKIVIGHDGSRVFIDPKNPRIEFWILKANEN